MSTDVSYRSGWLNKRPVLLAIGFIFGVAVSFALRFSSHHWSRPAEWDGDSLVARHVVAEGCDRYGQDLKVVSNGILFTVDVENKTAKDLEIKKDSKIMQSEKSSEALRDSMLEIEKDYFVPAYHTISIVLENSDLCGSDVPGKKCFDSYFGDVKQLTILDRDQRREVLVSVPTFTEPKPTGGVPVQLR